MSPRVAPRARSHADRAGDPLDGLVNLFDLGLVLAVGLLLAALASLKLTGLLGHGNFTVVQNPGTPQQSIIVKQGSHLQVISPTSQQVTGQGTALGTVYRLQDGRLVYVAKN
jgi:hypothetical protein